MTRRDFVRAGALVGGVPLLGSLGCGSSRAIDQFLVVVVDDVSQRFYRPYGDLWPNDAPPPTPVVDGLAESGMRFDRIHSNPVCSPTRLTLLYGDYAFRHGIGSIVGRREETEAPLDRPTLASHLKSHGFRTLCVGKWHLHKSDTRAPNRVGFDDYLAGSYFGAREYFEWKRVDNGVTTLSEEYATIAQARACTQWLTEHGDRPFFALLNFAAPHAPYHSPPAELLPAGHVFPDGERGLYERAISGIDHVLRDVVDAVDPERTAIVFLADNGTPGEVRHPRQGSARVKSSTFREGVEVPFLVRAPGITAGTSCAAIGGTVDLFATICELANVPLPGGAARDSVSLAPLLWNPEAPAPREQILTEKFSPNGKPPYEVTNRTLVEARYKLMRRQGGQDPGDKLFDVLADPRERSNLLAEADGRVPEPEHLQVARRLRRDLANLLG